MRIIYTKTVSLYLKELINILYQKNYFAYYESAQGYVLSIRQDMETSIHLKRKQIPHKRFSRYGKDIFFVAYPKNKQTTWYFFFTYHPKDDIYFIKYISNNHVTGHLLE